MSIKKNIGGESRKRYLKKSSKSGVKKSSIVLIFLFFISILTVVFIQNQHAIITRAQVTYSNLVPTYYCFGLGANCSLVPTGRVTFATSSGGLASGSGAPCPPAVVSVPLILDKKTVTQGSSISGTITFKETCATTYSDLLIVAHDPKGGVHAFTPSSGKVTLGPGQTASIAASLAISMTDPPGIWSASAAYKDLAGNIHEDANKLNFTVISSCAGLVVSKAITLDKTTVSIGSSISGAITYRNPCTIDYLVHAIIISARDPKGSVSDFAPSLGAMTFKPGQVATLSASRFMAAKDPLGLWKAFGAYQNNIGTWVVDNTLLSFTLAASPSAQPNASPSAQPNASPSAKPTAALTVKPTAAPQCSVSKSCASGQECDRGNVCKPAAGLNQACETARDIVGSNPTDPNGVHGTCVSNLYCITASDISSKCKTIGDCFGTCQTKPGGIMNGRTCTTANKLDWQGGCINGSKCDITKDTSANCKTNGKCTGVCVLR